MKILYSTLLATASTLWLCGCHSTASEEEKAAFSTQVRNFDNQQQQEQFDDAIEPGYQPSVGNPPAWETPAN